MRKSREPKSVEIDTGSLITDVAKNNSLVKPDEVNILAELDKPNEDNVDALIAAIDDDIIRYRRGGTPSEQDFKRALEQSLQYENYMRIFKERMIIGASVYVPGAVNTVGRGAVSGDIRAARLLFSLVGLPNKSATPQVVTNVQVNIPTIQDMIEQDVINIDSEEVIDV